jgi:hypothetical protein
VWRIRVPPAIVAGQTTDGAELPRVCRRKSPSSPAVYTVSNQAPIRGKRFTFAAQVHYNHPWPQAYVEGRNDVCYRGRRKRLRVHRVCAGGGRPAPAVLVHLT